MLSAGMKTDHIPNIKPKIEMRVNLGNSVVLTKCFSDDHIKDDFWGTEARKSVYNKTFTKRFER
jgi:hypothetical protein